MKFSVAALLALPLVASAYDGQWLDHKHGRRSLAEHGSKKRFLRQLQSELGEHVSFPGGFCPSLPAGRVATIPPNAANDGWTLVDFCLEGSTEAAGPAVPPQCTSNDDDSSSANLPFTFKMFGTDYTKVFINNNGNLSFDAIYSTFTPAGFPILGNKMIAPFWGDVDTGSPFSGNLGRVWQKFVGSNTFVVAWDHVGYFQENGNRKNTFAVMISDGTNGDMGHGNNVCFCYGDMQWTTGDFSGGQNGLLGSPATVGANNGDGTEFIQIGQYNEAGHGPSGVDRLDNWSTCFSVSGHNIPPIPTGIPPNNVVMIPCDESLTNLVIGFAAPENSQTITVTVDGIGASGVTVDIVDGGNSATATINWTPTMQFYVSLVFTATDSEGGQTVLTLPLIADGPCDTGMSGDPHVKTWAAGKWFDYMGECDLVLVSAPNFDGKGNDLDIHTRTTIRYDYSYIETAAIRIGEDILEVGSFGDYAINGVESRRIAEGNGLLGGYGIMHTQKDEKSSVFQVLLGPNENITISTFKDLVAVHINAGPESAEYFGKSVGMMGSYTGGDLLARDGITVMDDMEKYGQEWQVNGDDPKLFRTARQPQYPTQCRLPEEGKAVGRRLGESLAKDAAETACAHMSGSKFDNCVFDVMAVGDLELAKTYN